MNKLASVVYTNPLDEWLWESGAMWWILIVLGVVLTFSVSYLAFEAWRARRNRRAKK